MGLTFLRKAITFFLSDFGFLSQHPLCSIIKDTVPVVFNIQDVGEDDFLKRDVVMIVTSLIIILPLAMLRDMASLAVTSLLSVLADVILVGFVVGFSPISSTVQENGGFGKVLGENWANSRLFIGLGVLSTAMACQHSAFIVSGSLENKTAARWSTVTFRSISLSAFLCIMMGVCGYLGFLDETQGDILNSFDSDALAANAGRALLAVTMFFTYPMESFVARHVLCKLFFNGDMDNTSVGSNGEVIPESKMFGFFGRREQLTFCIYIMTLLPALIFDDLGPVLSLTGAVGASCLAYIGPGLVYLGVNGEDFLDYCGKLVHDRSYTKKESGSEIELPVVGDANATMEATSQNDNGLPQSSAKPWWWWALGFPIWVAIALTGSHGTRNFLTAWETEVGVEHRGQSQDDDEVIPPLKRDYYISMFMITFGAIACVVGVISNIYVQVNDVFYTPT